MSRKVVAYIRVSTEEQAKHGYSIDVQRQVLEDYAQGHDLEVVATFAESESAFKPGRPGFAQMVELLEKSKPITAVLVYKIDRIARNMLDYSTLVDKMGLNVISATEELPSNATGRLMGDMQAAFSRYFSAQLSDRVTEAMTAKARKGIYPSYAPVGYVNDRETRTIIPDPERAHLVREAFDVYANTEMTLSDVVEWAKKRGLTTRRSGTFAKSTIHKMLLNPIYVGTIRWGDVTATGIHEPLISRHLFEKVQGKLEGRGQGRGNPHKRFPFRGILVCGYCGCQITASEAKGKYIYYHCTHGKGKCKQPYVRQQDLSKRLQSIVDNVRVPEEVVAKLLKEIKKGEASREERITDRLQELQTERDEITRRRDRAYLDKQDGEISTERWRELEKAWTDRIGLIEEQQEHLANSLHSKGTDNAREAFELLERASDLYSEQTPGEQAEGLRILVSNCKVRGKKLEPNYKKPFDLVAKGSELASGTPERTRTSDLRSRSATL